MFGGGSDSARTDGSGAFLFEHLKPGRYKLSAQATAGKSVPKDVVLAENQRQEGILLSMASGARVQGTVSGLPAGESGVLRDRPFAEGASGIPGASAHEDSIRWASSPRRERRAVTSAYSAATKNAFPKTIRRTASTPKTKVTPRPPGRRY